MKNTKKLIGTYIIALLFILSVSTVLRTVALFTSFNDKTMHFDGGITFSISAFFALAGVIFSLTYFSVAPKKYGLAPDCSAPQTFIPSGILSVAFLFTSFSMLLHFSSQQPPNDGFVDKIVYYIPAALALLALLSAAYIFMNIMITARTSTAKAALGLCTVAFLAIYGIFLYFNNDVQPINAPNKIIDQMAYFFCSLFFLFETRISLGRDLWKAYTAFGLISVLLTGYSSIPALIFYLVDGSTVSVSIVETVLTLTLFVYIFTKLVLTLRYPDDTQCKMANIIEKIATQREAELAEHRNANRADTTDQYAEEELDSAEDVEESSSVNDGENEDQISFELDPPQSQNGDI